MDPSPIYLIGFMAAGKSTVGRLVATGLGRRFLDLDERVEELAEKPIARVFREDGEPAFRRIEAQALGSAAREQGVVVACGGGTPIFGENLALMRNSGVVVALRVGLDEVLARSGAEVSTRPLLTGGRAAAEKLFAEREKVYLVADAVVETAGRPPEEVAGEVTRRARNRLGDIAVKLAEREYPIHVAPLAEAGALVEEMIPGAGTIAIITDQNLARVGHAQAVRAALESAGHRTIEVVVPPGEGSKSLKQVGRIAEACVAGGLDRRSAIVAVGGGVVGDLAGFVAAILYRGIRYGQVPTTLLAMADSAIGGKTGVDLPEGKNLVGAFWQPRFVLADPLTLATLPERERLAGFAEVVKVALLGDPALLERLEKEGAAADPRELVLRSARFKAALVERDERETTGERALLNLGHTFGHAIEIASKYERLHGEAVALGLVAAARVSARLHIGDDTLESRVVSVLRKIGLDAALDPWLRDDVLAFLSVDKKRAGKKLRFVALEAAFRPRVIELAPEELTRALR